MTCFLFFWLLHWSGGGGEGEGQKTMTNTKRSMSNFSNPGFLSPKKNCCIDSLKKRLDCYVHLCLVHFLIFSWNQRKKLHLFPLYRARQKTKPCDCHWCLSLRACGFFLFIMLSNILQMLGNSVKQLAD